MEAEELFLTIPCVVESIEQNGSRWILKINNNGEHLDFIVSKYDIDSIVIGEEVLATIRITADNSKVQIHYGFIKEDVGQLIKQICSTPGVGPITAINTINYGTAEGKTPHDIAFEIASGNVDYLAKATRSGTKVAQRIINKLQSTIRVDMPSPNHTDPRKRESFEMLQSLGFVPIDITKALEDIEITDEMQVMDIVQLAITKMQS